MFAAFAECKLTGSRFDDAKLAGLTITHGDWSYVDLAKQDLRGRDLYGACVSLTRISNAATWKRRICATPTSPTRTWRLRACATPTCVARC